MYGDLRLILLLLVFLGLFASLCFYFYFYRKYSRELSKSFHLLSDKQYLDVNDYLFYEQLGLPGFWLERPQSKIEKKILLRRQRH